MVANQNAQWVDGPYKLLRTPASHRDIKSHFAVHMANDMAYVHNAFIRGFNSIILQGPHLPSHDQSGFIAKDVKDFMIFTDSLIKSLDHHHTSEEKVAFPEIEKEIGLPGYLSVAAEQHHIFHDGLHALWDYAKAKQDKPEKYKWEDMEKLMNEFMPALQKHLVEEVDLFLTLDRFDEEGLRKAWKFIEGEAKTVGIAGFYYLFPIFFGCHDRTYEKGDAFPPIPDIFRYLVKYWFGLRYGGAWRYCPCDVWSRPQPLFFTKGIK